MPLNWEALWQTVVFLDSPLDDSISMQLEKTAPGTYSKYCGHHKMLATLQLYIHSSIDL